MKLTGPAAPGARPRSTSQLRSGSARVLAPKAAEDRLASVTPTWTAARNRFGPASSLLSACPRRPVSASARTWDSRSETSASSAPEKTPPIRTKTTTMTMLSQTSLTGGALLGVFGWGSHPPWCLVGANGRSRSVAPPLGRDRQLAERDVFLGDFP